MPPDSPPPHGSNATRLADGRVLTTEQLAALLYDDLRRLAGAYFRREAPGATLQPTALVHEACVQLLGQERQDWESRGHFLSIAATTMRRVLLNAARDRRREKRGGGRAPITLGDDLLAEAPARSVIELDEALSRLAAVDERYVRIIELRYFAGLSLEETAEVLGVSRTMIVREWAKARALLEAALTPPP